MRRVIGVIVAGLIVASCNKQSASNTMEATEGAVVDIDTPLQFCDAVKTRVTAEECDDLTGLKQALYRGGAAINYEPTMTRGTAYTITLLVDSRTARVIDAIETPTPPPPQPPESTPAIEPAPTEEPADDPAGNMSSDAAGNMAGNQADLTPMPPLEDQAATPSQVLEKEFSGETESFRPWVGHFMRAALRGDGFDIVSLDAKVEEDGGVAKELPDNSQVSWKWRVTPKEGGARKLFVETKVEGRVNGKVFVLAPSETFRSVTVTVGPIDWLKDQFIYFADWLKSLEGLLVSFAAVVTAWLALRALFRRKKAREDATPPPG